MPKVVPEYKDEARKRIIEQALVTFSEKGYYKTRMVDIAEKMGVSKGAIYQYFSSKRDLFLAVVQYHTSMREKVMRRFLQSGSIEVIASGAFFDQMLSVRMGSFLLTQDLIQELTDDSFKIELSDMTDNWVSGLRDLIDKYKQEGVVKSDVDSDAIARGMIALRDGLYGSIDLGADVEKVKTSWTSVMKALMKDVLS